MKRTKKVLSIIVLIITMAVSASLFSACNAKVSDSVFAFGTVSEISLKGKKVKNTIKPLIPFSQGWTFCLTRKMRKAMFTR